MGYKVSYLSEILILYATVVFIRACYNLYNVICTNVENYFVTNNRQYSVNRFADLTTHWISQQFMVDFTHPIINIIRVTIIFVDFVKQQFYSRHGISDLLYCEFNILSGSIWISEIGGEKYWIYMLIYLISSTYMLIYLIFSTIYANIFNIFHRLFCFSSFEKNKYFCCCFYLIHINCT